MLPQTRIPSVSPALLLIFAWAMFLASLLAPAFYGFGILGDPPVFLMVILAVLIPWTFPMSLAAFSFILSPIIALAHPHGLARALWRLFSLTMLGAWVLPAWAGAASAFGFFSPFTNGTSIGWGYYLLACACTVCWIATLLNSEPSSAHSGGFPVVIPEDRPPLDAPEDGP